MFVVQSSEQPPRRRRTGSREQVDVTNESMSSRIFYNNDGFEGLLTPYLMRART
jgi:hypothetical protein